MSTKNKRYINLKRGCKIYGGKAEKPQKSYGKPEKSIYFRGKPESDPLLQALLKQVFEKIDKNLMSSIPFWKKLKKAY